MKKVAGIIAVLPILLFAISLLPGCSENKQGTKEVLEELLSTVPKDADFVVVFNGDSILNKLDVKNENGKLIVGKELRDMIGNIGLVKDLDSLSLYGVNPNIVIFLDRKDMYITGKLDDKKLFTDLLKKNDMSFVSQSGYDVYDKGLAVKDNRFWVNFANDIDVKDLEVLCKLPEDESLVSTPRGKSIIEADKELYMTSNFEKLSSTGGDAMINKLILGMIYDDLQCFTLDFAFRPQTMEIDCLGYDSEWKKSKLKFNIDNIDCSVLSKLAGEKTVISASSVPTELISAVLKMAETMMPAEVKQNDEFRSYMDLIKALKGTFAVSCDFTKGFSAGEGLIVSMVVPFADNSTAQKAKELIESIPDLAETAAENNISYTLNVDDNLLVANVGKETLTPTPVNPEIKSVFEGKQSALYIDFSKLPDMVFEEVPTLREIKTMESYQKVENKEWDGKLIIRTNSSQSNSMLTLIKVINDVVKSMAEASAREEDGYTTIGELDDDIFEGDDFPIGDLEPVEEEIIY